MEEIRLRKRSAGWKAFAALVLFIPSLVEAAPPLDEKDLPHLEKLDLFQPGEPALLYADDGTPFATFTPEYRIFIPFHQIPKSLKDAVIAIEDARFYEHGPVDLKGMVRAALKNLTAFKIKEGGSTITQQLAKILFLTPERTLGRKLKELKLADELEARYSKDKILEMYLNVVYFGHGAYGVEAAARTYFSKKASELTLDEAALLAGLIRSPARYSPLLHPKEAKERRNGVLKRMAELRLISPSQAKAAMRIPLRIDPLFKLKGIAPSFVDHLRQELEGRYSPEMLKRGRLKIYTTLSLPMQKAAVLALKAGLQRIERGKRGSPLEGAFLAVDPRTGEIKAMVGGIDYGRSQFNRAVQMKRQPGSAFKPFVYAKAIEQGFTPADLLPDQPVSYPLGLGKQKEPWTPENFDRTFRGPVTLRRALEESINVPTVRLIEAVGVDPVIELARRMGIGSELRREYALALGVSEVSLLELVSAYGAFANQGMRAAPFAIRKVVGPNGEILEEGVPVATRVLQEEVAYTITSILQGAVERGTAKQARALERPVAAKTGTSQDAHDLWFIGYTPSLVAGLWIGYDVPQSLGSHESAGHLAAPLWVNFMQQALKGTPPEIFPMPEGVFTALVNAKTGLPTSSDDPEALLEVFIRGEGKEPPTELATEVQWTSSTDPLPLQLPPGFRITVFAERLEMPRFMAVSPEGILFVSLPSSGQVVALPDKDGDGRADRIVTVASGLNAPHGLAFFKGSLYVAETGRILRLQDRDGDLRADKIEVIVPHLPPGGNHWSRTIGFGPDGKLYVSIGSSCNVCIERDHRRATILRYNPDGTGEEIVAQGLRNAVGFTWHPETKMLWATNNGRDWLGDDLPPDYITIVQEGAHYGWPSCYAHQGKAILDPEFGRPEVCQQMALPTFEIQAHSAPLGLTFYTGTLFPPEYQGDLFVAYHGSWNRSVPTGYKVVRIPMKEGKPGKPEDFVTGWLRGGRAWGRPVDLVVGRDGALYLSDDGAGFIYRITYKR